MRARRVAGLCRHRAGDRVSSSRCSPPNSRTSSSPCSALGIVAVLAAAWLGLLGGVSRSFAEHEDAMGVFADRRRCVVVVAYFHEDHFVLLLVVTVLLYSVATLGLNIQFGYAGVLNFAGASFFGIGAYTSAVLNTYTALPHLLVLLIGGLVAALIGSLLLLPVLRTRGHYAAVVTIAFALLFKTFLEVNDVARRPAGHAGAEHEDLRLVVQRQHRDRRHHVLVLHELFRASACCC